ncbi:MAG: hypothetical protein IH960_08820 [Chloroflexi bacterium]|nr:hypothetical protein [Chloroflexota bacterium]
MNHSQSRLRTNPRIVPQDLLLKFGYSPDNGIKFDSAAQTLSFYQGGIQRVDINSFGLAVRNGEGLVVGHTAQLSIGGGIQEFQVIGASFDAEMAVATFRNDAFGPGFRFLKSRATTPGDNVADPGTYNDGDDLGFIRWHVDDGADYASYAAQIFVEADDTAFAENDVPGRMIFATSPDGAASPTEALRIDSSQNVQMRSESVLWIGPDSAATGFVDANTAVGIVINQEANDNHFITLKSSDVAHGLTGWYVSNETDDVFIIQKSSPTQGGIQMGIINEDDANQTPFRLSVAGGTAHTVKTTSGKGLITFYLTEHNGAGSQSDITANGNIFAIHARVGGSDQARFLLDEDGDIFVVTAVDVTGSGNAVAATAFDDFADAELVRAFDVARSPKSIVRTEWDKHVRYNEQTLIDLGVLGAPIADGGLTNITQLQRLHNGAIWQQHTAHMSLVERVDALTSQLAIASKQLAALTA